MPIQWNSIPAKCLNEKCKEKWFSLIYSYFFSPLSESIHNTEIGMKLPENLCNQIFDDCLEPNKCRLLSPNYPGFYPRNKTCHYLIRQKVDSSQIGSGLGPRITINQVRK